MKRMIYVKETIQTYVLVDVDEDVDAERLVQAIHGTYGIETKNSSYESSYLDVTGTFSSQQAMEHFADISFGKDEYDLDELEREQNLKVRKNG